MAIIIIRKSDKAFLEWDGFIFVNWTNNRRRAQRFPDRADAKEFLRRMGGFKSLKHYSFFRVRD